MEIRACSDACLSAGLFGESDTVDVQIGRANGKFAFTCVVGATTQTKTWRVEPEVV